MSQVACKKECVTDDLKIITQTSPNIHRYVQKKVKKDLSSELIFFHFRPISMTTNTSETCIYATTTKHNKPYIYYNISTFAKYKSAQQKMSSLSLSVFQLSHQRISFHVRVQVNI